MLKILLVEDNPGDQELFKVALKESGIQADIQVAFSSQETIEIMLALKPNLIVMDIMMPGLSGDDFVSLLQNSPYSFSSVPVIFLSGNKLDDMFSMGLTNEIQIGDKIYPSLSKPVDAEVLKKCIMKALVIT